MVSASVIEIKWKTNVAGISIIEMSSAFVIKFKDVIFNWSLDLFFSSFKMKINCIVINFDSYNFPLKTLGLLKFLVIIKGLYISETSSFMILVLRSV